MRTFAVIALVAGCLIAAACNTWRGAKEDVNSVGRVFTDHPDKPK